MTLTQCLVVSSHELTPKHEAKHEQLRNGCLFVCEAVERAAFGFYIRV